MKIEEVCSEFCRAAEMAFRSGFDFFKGKKPEIDILLSLQSKVRCILPGKLFSEQWARRS